MPPSSSVENGEGSVSAGGRFPEDQSAEQMGWGRHRQERHIQQKLLSRLSLSITHSLSRSPFLSLIAHNPHSSHCVDFWLCFCRGESSLAGDLYVPAVQGVPDRPTVAHPPNLPTKRVRLTLRWPGFMTGPGDEAVHRRAKWPSGGGSRSARRGFSQCPDSARISPVRRSSAPAMPLPPGRSATCRR